MTVEEIIEEEIEELLYIAQDKMESIKEKKKEMENNEMIVKRKKQNRKRKWKDPGHHGRWGQ